MASPVSLVSSCIRPGNWHIILERGVPDSDARFRQQMTRKFWLPLSGAAQSKARTETKWSGYGAGPAAPAVKEFLEEAVVVCGEDMQRFAVRQYRVKHFKKIIMWSGCEGA